MAIGYMRGPDALSDHELSHLADWADTEAREVPNPTWKRAYALLREGADLLLRRRAMSKVDTSCCKEEKESHKPECKICYDEDGSLKCIRIAHQRTKVANNLV